MTDHPERHDGFVNPSVKYEPTDLSLRAVLIFSGVLAVAVVLVSVGLYFMIPAILGPTQPAAPFTSNENGPWKKWNEVKENAPPLQDSRVPQPPELEAIDRIAPPDQGGGTHTRTIQKQIEEEEARLNSKGEDKETGKAHIPIEEAMKKVAAELGGKP